MSPGDPKCVPKTCPRRPQAPQKVSGLPPRPQALPKSSMNVPEPFNKYTFSLFFTGFHGFSGPEEL